MYVKLELEACYYVTYDYLLLIFVAVFCTIINDFCGMHLLSSFSGTFPFKGGGMWCIFVSC